MRIFSTSIAAVLSALLIRKVAAGPAMLALDIAIVAAVAGTVTGAACTAVDANEDAEHNGNCKNDKRSGKEAAQLQPDGQRWIQDFKRTALPPGVPQFVLDNCRAEVSAAAPGAIVVNGPVGNNGIRIDGVPPTCMTLATVINGDPVNGPYPVPMGSAALQYNDLTVEQYNQFKTIFEQHKV